MLQNSLPPQLFFRRFFHCSRFSSSSNCNPKPTVLVLGCNGSLGSTIKSRLRQKDASKAIIVGADIHPARDSAYTPIDSFIEIEKDSPDKVSDCLLRGFREVFPTKPEFDVVICANGGFATDENPISDELIAMNYYPLEAMTSKVMLPFISSKEALLVAFGAAAARRQVSENSRMKTYIASKVLVHDHIQRLGSITGKALRPSKRFQDVLLRKQFQCLHKLTAVAILPSTLDTETNRKLMNPSDQDLQSWTKMDDIAEEISKWITMKQLRPSSGSLVKCVTENGLTDFVISR